MQDDAQSEALNENVIEVEGLEKSLDRAGIQKYLTYLYQKYRKVEMGKRFFAGWDIKNV